MNPSSELTSSAKGPSLILNSGSVDNVSLSSPDKFGNYSLTYSVGIYNKTFVELKRICDELAKGNDYNMDASNFRKPWTVDTSTNMVKIRVNNKRAPAILNQDKKQIDVKLVRDGSFAKINITPFLYVMTERSSYVDPSGKRVVFTQPNHGIKLYFNGLMLTQTEELF